VEHASLAWVRRGCSGLVASLWRLQVHALVYIINSCIQLCSTFMTGLILGVLGLPPRWFLAIWPCRRVGGFSCLRFAYLAIPAEGFTELLAHTSCKMPIYDSTRQ